MKKVLFFLLTINIIFAQDKVIYDYEICNSLFSMELEKNFENRISEKFIFNKNHSYSYYIDFDTKQNVKLSFEDSKSTSCIPYQYVLNYELVDEKLNILKSFNISFSYNNGLLQMESLGNFKNFFKPYILVLNNKIISVQKALSIAKKNGYNINSFSLDYYNTNRSKIVWILKELVHDEEGKELFYKVILISGRNGRVLKKYEEFRL